MAANGDGDREQSKDARHGAHAYRRLGAGVNAGCCVEGRIAAESRKMMMVMLAQGEPIRRIPQRGRNRGLIRRVSCGLDDDHWATALRYVEMNPVRARLLPQ